MGGGSKQQHLLFTLAFPEPAALIADVRKAHPNIKVTYLRQEPDHPFSEENKLPDDLWKDVTILTTLTVLPRDPKLAPNLELIQFLSAGTNHIEKHPIYTDTKITLTSSSGIHGPQISEWVLMTLLASSHNYNLLHSWQRAAHWEHYNSSSKQLWKTRDSVGQTLGILGYGSIGRQVARVGKAMGMKVLAYTASQRKTEESKRDSGFIVDGTGDPDGSIPSAWFFGFDKEKLHEFLRQDIDVLLVSVPLTKATTKILGKEEFEILGRKNAFISNISRGKIIDQDALITSLRQFDDDSKTSPSSNHHLDNPQQSPPQPSISQSSSEPSPSQPSSLPSSQLTKKRGLRGAALDVTDPEPLPDGHPLWTTPNCIVTPHISGLGDKYIERAFEVLKLNLDRFERGEKLVNVVDRERGY